MRHPGSLRMLLCPKMVAIDISPLYNSLHLPVFTVPLRSHFVKYLVSSHGEPHHHPRSCSAQPSSNTQNLSPGLQTQTVWLESPGTDSLAACRNLPSRLLSFSRTRRHHEDLSVRCPLCRNSNFNTQHPTAPKFCRSNRHGFLADHSRNHVSGGAGKDRISVGSFRQRGR